MLITKKESKDLRYFARANYKSDVKGVDTGNGKIKHREFPVFGLSYDEAKADKGLVELTNIVLDGQPFDGSYTDLMTRLREILDAPVETAPTEPSDYVKETCACLLAGPDCKQTPILPSPSIVQRIKTSPTGIVLTSLAEQVALIEHPNAEVKKVDFSGYSEDGTLTMDVKCTIPNTSHSVNVQVAVPTADKPTLDSVAQDAAYEGVKADIERKLCAPDSDPVKSVEQTTERVVGDVLPNGSEVEAHVTDIKDGVAHIDMGVAIPAEAVVAEGVVEEASVAESLEYLATHEPPPLKVAPLEKPQELPVVENVEEAKQVVEETGKPVITAVQKPKTRWELFDLRIKCATMALAKSYGEPSESDIGTIMSRYSDAMDKLNALYAKDRIQPYTISEDAIKNAYPDEYATLSP